MGKPAPLHQIVEQSIPAADISSLVKPDTVVWAKLRGYPWWPGRVKSLSEIPKELAQIARTQYKAGTITAVYFFGSHDYSLVPLDSLRPFEENWDLFSSRSMGIKFKEALREARGLVKSPVNSDSPDTAKMANSVASDDTPVVKRKRGRPPKNPKPDILQQHQPTKYLRMKKRPSHFDSEGNVTKAHVLYCRIKLQKILFRDLLKERELEVAHRIMDVISSDKISIDNMRNTKIGKVLRLASRRNEFRNRGPYPEIGIKMNEILGTWRGIVDQFVSEIGIM